MVIGILIALQINNLNEEHKNRQYELKMLKEVDKALKAELKNVDVKIARMEGLDSTTRSITNYIASGGKFNDSITNILPSSLFPVSIQRTLSSARHQKWPAPGRPGRCTCR